MKQDGPMERAGQRNGAAATLEKNDNYANQDIYSAAFWRRRSRGGNEQVFGDEKKILEGQVAVLNEKVKALKVELKPPIISSTEVGVSFLGYRAERNECFWNTL